METVIDILSSKLTWFAFTFILGVIVKKKRDTYLKLLHLLIQGVEIIDKDIINIVKGEQEAKLCKIKHWIANKVGRKEAKLLNVELVKSNLKKKSR